MTDTTNQIARLNLEWMHDSLDCAIVCLVQMGRLPEPFSKRNINLLAKLGRRYQELAEIATEMLETDAKKVKQ